MIIINGRENAVQPDGSGRAVFSPVAWDDLQVSLGEVKLPGVSDPAWAAYMGGRVLAFAKAADNEISFTAQLPHSYKLESDLEFHIHVAYPDGGAGNSRWHLTHSLAPIGSDFPSETTVSVTVASPADQDRHTLHEIAGTISGASLTGVSGMIIGSLKREGTAVVDDYDNSIYLIGLDFHFQKDTIGSLQEAVK